ncbi:MAG: NERD domain-containing protein [bacterium]|nr:NERD domain-containing protein [bacterium]
MDNQKSMTLEQARDVMWLRNKYRPLGELFDEGFLNRRRLEWAAANAYKPELKQAAAVILDWMNRTPAAPAQEPVSPPPSGAQQLPTVEAGVTIEQARATLWPLKPFKGQPMGNLVNSHQLTLKDLGYAIENAWEQSVRQAAIVLMALRLNQVVKEPPPPAGPLKVVSGGRSYAERRQFFLTLIQGTISGAALGILILFTLQSFIKRTTSPPSQAPEEVFGSPESIVALVIVLALLIGVSWLSYYLFKLAFDKLDKQIDNYRKGQKGEDQVVDVMRQNLDGHWTLFRNVTLPGRNKADIDAVLVGPPGVWALEVKAFTGEYKNIGEHWQIRAGGWKLLKSSPSRQAQNNAVRLSNFFKADGIKQWVTAVVVWANRESPLSVENPMVAVWTFDRLPDELGNIWQGQETKESIRTRIVEKLSKLCQRDEEAN